jgi:hypothetical protein
MNSCHLVGRYDGKFAASCDLPLISYVSAAISYYLIQSRTRGEVRSS